MLILLFWFLLFKQLHTLLCSLWVIASKCISHTYFSVLLQCTSRLPPLLITPSNSGMKLLMSQEPTDKSFLGYIPGSSISGSGEQAYLNSEWLYPFPVPIYTYLYCQLMHFSSLHPGIFWNMWKPTFLNGVLGGLLADSVEIPVWSLQMRVRTGSWSQLSL